MSTSSVQTTAKIIQFPVGGRKAPIDICKQALPVSDFAVQTVAAGEAWYHEAAIQDAKLGGER